MLLPVYYNCTLVQFCLRFGSSTGNFTAHARHATSTEPEDVTTVSRHSVPDGAGVLGEVWAGVADGDGSVRGDGVRRQNKRVRLESQHQELARERLRRLHLRCLQLTRSRNTNDDAEAYVTSHALLIVGSFWAAYFIFICSGLDEREPVGTLPTIEFVYKPDEPVRPTKRPKESGNSPNEIEYNNDNKRDHDDNGGKFPKIDT